MYRLTSIDWSVVVLKGVTSIQIVRRGDRAARRRVLLRIDLDVFSMRSPKK